MNRLVLAALLLVLPPALLAGNEVYGGIGIGYGTIKISLPTEKFEGVSMATRENVGVRVGDYFAAEAGFIRFNKINDQVRGDDPTQPAFNRSIQTSGYPVYLIGSYPLDPELIAFGKVGMIRWKSTVRNQNSEFSEGLDGDDLAYGFGLDFRSIGRVRVRVEAEFFDLDFVDSYWALTTTVMYGIPFEF